MLTYSLTPQVQAFTLGVGAVGTAPGADAREMGISEGSFSLPRTQLMIPRQTHSTNVAWVDTSGEVADTDAVITSVPATRGCDSCWMARHGRAYCGTNARGDAK